MKSASTIHRMRKPGTPKGTVLHGLANMSEDVGVLPADAMQRLQQAGTTRIWKPHEVLYFAGSAPTAVFLVCTGRLRFRQFDSEGRERILGWAKPGMMACLSYAVADQPSGLDFVADVRSEVVRVSRERLLDLFRTEPETGLAIMRALSERMVEMVDIYMTQSYDQLADKVWSCLERLARQANAAPGPHGRELRVTQEVLANAVGASRYRVGLELQRLSERGRIVLSRGCIRLVPPG